MVETPLFSVCAQAGACWVEDAGWQVPDHFGSATAECVHARERAAVFDLCHFGKVELAGPDALLFLHNLCTNDVKNLPPGAGCEAFLTNAKAKVQAHVLVGHFRDNQRDWVWLDFVPGQVDKVLAHLNHYLISEQVELADRTRELALLHICGREAVEIVRKWHSPETISPLWHQTLSLDEVGICYLRRHDPLGPPGFDFFCRPETAPALWQRLVSAGARPAGRQAWDILRIEAGTPVYGRDMDDNRFVVELGRSNAISFTKGCYLGQEPIVMARDRGQVNRTLMGLKMTGNEPARPGMLLYRNGSEVGQVTSAAVSPRLGPIALAYMRRGCQEPGTVVGLEASKDAGKAVVTSLPFA
jgi:folate-binding protein YgfZ